MIANNNKNDKATDIIFLKDNLFPIPKINFKFSFLLTDLNLDIAKILSTNSLIFSIVSDFLLLIFRWGELIIIFFFGFLSFLAITFENN